MSRLSLCALLLFAPMLFADKAEPEDAKAPKPRELTLKTARPAGKPAGATKPTKVTTKEELAKIVSGKEGVEEITKQVDLKKEYLVVFSWGGSGGDRLSFTTSETKAGPKVTFTLKRGLTRDFRMHFKVFALPAKATYEMGK
jgi:hypothetical protein